MGVAFEGLDDQVVDGKPDGATPVGVAAEHVGIAFAGDVIDTMFGLTRVEDVGVVEVVAREGADAVGREKFLFIQQAGEEALKSVA